MSDKNRSLFPGDKMKVYKKECPWCELQTKHEVWEHEMALGIYQAAEEKAKKAAAKKALTKSNKKKGGR